MVYHNFVCSSCKSSEVLPHHWIGLRKKLGSFCWWKPRFHPEPPSRVGVATSAPAPQRFRRRRRPHGGCGCNGYPRPGELDGALRLGSEVSSMYLQMYDIWTFGQQINLLVEASELYPLFRCFIQYSLIQLPYRQLFASHLFSGSMCA